MQRRDTEKVSNMPQQVRNLATPNGVLHVLVSVSASMLTVSVFHLCLSVSLRPVLSHSLSFSCNYDCLSRLPAAFLSPSRILSTSARSCHLDSSIHTPLSGLPYLASPHLVTFSHCATSAVRRDQPVQNPQSDDGWR